MAGINSSGAVSYWQANDHGAIQAVTWQNGIVRRLGALNGDQSSVSHGINGNGQLVGWSVSGNNPVDSLARTHAFVYDHGHMKDLGTLGGRDSQALAINCAGVIAGFSELPNGVKHAFIYKNGCLSDLGTLPGGAYSAAMSINIRGLVAGVAETLGHSTHAAAWQGNTVLDLGALPGGVRSFALAVNDHGDIVGFSDVDHQEIHGFLYTNGKLRDIGSLGKDPTCADGINNMRQIVGLSGVSDHVRHAFLWQNGKMTDLNRLVPEGEWRLQEAFAINDRGQIVCAARKAAGSGGNRLVLLTRAKTGSLNSPKPHQRPSSPFPLNCPGLFPLPATSMGTPDRSHCGMIGPLAM